MRGLSWTSVCMGLGLFIFASSAFCASSSFMCLRFGQTVESLSCLVRDHGLHRI